MVARQFPCMWSHGTPELGDEKPASPILLFIFRCRSTFERATRIWFQLACTPAGIRVQDQLPALRSSRPCADSSFWWRTGFPPPAECMRCRLHPLFSCPFNFLPCGRRGLWPTIHGATQPATTTWWTCTPRYADPASMALGRKGSRFGFVVSRNPSSLYAIHLKVSSPSPLYPPALFRVLPIVHFLSV